MERTYTVGSVMGRMDTPSLRLTGKWLVENGFNIGDKLKLIDSKNMLVLIKIPKREVELQQRHKELKILEEKIKYLSK